MPPGVHSSQHPGEPGQTPRTRRFQHQQHWDFHSLGLVSEFQKAHFITSSFEKYLPSIHREPGARHAPTGHTQRRVRSSGRGRVAPLGGGWLSVTSAGTEDPAGWAGGGTGEGRGSDARPAMSTRIETQTMGRSGLRGRGTVGEKIPGLRVDSQIHEKKSCLNLGDITTIHMLTVLRFMTAFQASAPIPVHLPSMSRGPASTCSSRQPPRHTSVLPASVPVMLGYTEKYVCLVLVCSWHKSCESPFKFLIGVRRASFIIHNKPPVTQTYLSLC